MLKFSTEFESDEQRGSSRKNRRSAPRNNFLLCSFVLFAFLHVEMIYRGVGRIGLTIISNLRHLVIALEAAVGS